MRYAVSSMLFANVVVDTYQDPTKKLFTYQIPENMETQAKNGVKATVPFGKRTVEGYIWSTTPKKPPFPTKSIQEIKSRTFSDSQMKLAQWMSRYYLAPPLDCLKCQLGKKGLQATSASRSEINTLLLVPYASQVEIRALTSKKTLVGSRSAIFAQLPNLKKIIIEEPENWNYKDERSPYYHVKNVARKRSEIENLKLELRYQSPRVEDYKNENLKPPKIKQPKVIDLNQEKAAGNFTFISQDLEALIQHRRHTIVYTTSKGLQEVIKENTLKIGGDKNLMEIYGPELFSIPGKETDHLFWTDVDTLLNLPDFRAHEKIVWTVQKLSRIAKKALYLQTSSPNHPLFTNLSSKGLPNFYGRELKDRQELSYPPSSTLVKLTFTSRSTAKTNLEAEKMCERLLEINGQRTDLKVSPPYLPYSSTPRKVQLNIAIKIPQGPRLQASLDKLSKVVGPEWRVEVDPESLL